MAAAKSASPKSSRKSGSENGQSGLGAGDSLAPKSGARGQARTAARSAASAAKASRRMDQAMLETPTDLGPDAVQAVSDAINGLVADAFALYVKTKNFHWHVSGPHFRDYHLLLDEHAAQIFASTDPLAERVRKIGGKTLRSIGHIARLQRVQDNDAEFVSAADMLRELLADNKAMAAAMRQAHDVCDEQNDVATASLLEELIDETERRTWFLFEASRTADESGH
ncbi:DNA starvation/stationary phase protection protein [Alsobacter soli]|uniref:DNA starvation/stationary phase protection protein n=2 Tax=Alsobacter soli TaxID=2109933 RepID=A0A2T1HVX7_9HYPH|nr:DNA starvation/stationary phase protection protein [Alsobacter soli]